MDPNNWSDLRKVKWHLENNDGFIIREADDIQNKTGYEVVVFQGSNYLGYAWHKLTRPIKKVLDEFTKNYWLSPSKERSKR